MTFATMDGDEGGFRVIYEGQLTKSPEKISKFHKWQSRYFVLRKGKRLEYWNDSSQGEMKGCINLKKCFGVSDSEDKYSKKGYAFSVHLPQRKYVLVADSSDLRSSWVTALKLVCGLTTKKILTQEDEERERGITISTDDFRDGAEDGSQPINPSISSVRTNASSNSYFEESDEEADHADEDSNPMAHRLTMGEARPLRKIDSFQEVPELMDGDSATHGTGVGDMADSNMFQNPLRKMRQASVRKKGPSGELTYEATYTAKKKSINVFIKIAKPNIYVTNKDTMLDVFAWTFDDVDTYSQDKSILTINTADGEEHVFVVGDGNVASAIARAEIA